MRRLLLSSQGHSLTCICVTDNGWFSVTDNDWFSVTDNDWFSVTDNDWFRGIM